MATDLISRASELSQSIHKQMHVASMALRRPYSVDGFGIIRDQYQVLTALTEAMTAVEAARKLLADFERPSDAEYDQFAG
jgi:hypothetical protein